MTEENGNRQSVPQITDRLTWQAKMDELRVREKARTRAGDARAAERRRLPMVEVDQQTPLIGADGPVTLIDLFDGRSQLIAYGRGNEVMAPSYGLLDLTVYGRQEFWDDSPDGWPQHWDSKGGQFRLDGRPTAQWSRIRAGRNDDLGTTADGRHYGPHAKHP